MEDPSEIMAYIASRDTSFDLIAISRNDGKQCECNVSRSIERLAANYGISEEEVKRLLNSGAELATISFVYRLRSAKEIR